MAVVIDLFGCVQATPGLKLLAAAIGGCCGYGHLFRRAITQTINIKGFGTIQPKAVGAFAIHEVQRQHTHANQVGTVDTFKAGSDDSFNTQ